MSAFSGVFGLSRSNCPAARPANRAILLANGHGDWLAVEERLSAADYLVAFDLMRGQTHPSQIFSALELDIHALERVLPALISG